MEMISFNNLSPVHHDEAAEVLMQALRHPPSAWPDMEQARAEVETFLADDERSAIAAIESSRVQGWIGAIHHSPHAWELHPLVVRPERQGRGCGTLLVRAL
jgi:aminoglycoside 6'-N-acetyltransferase I